MLLNLSPCSRASPLHFGTSCKVSLISGGSLPQRPHVVRLQRHGRFVVAAVGFFAVSRSRGPRSTRRCSGSGSCDVFFDTHGRLARGPPESDACSKLYVPVYDGLSCVQPAPGGGLQPVLLMPSDAEQFLADSDCIEVCIGTAKAGPLAECVSAAAGTEDGTPATFWLLDLSHLPEPPSLSSEASWLPLRARAGPSICDVGRPDALATDDYAALLGTARGLGLWHRSIPFCSACGARTVPCRAGRNRQCENCGARYRPRLDPSVIVLVVNGRRCLLGRLPKWPAGRYSTLAGFVEFGETFEECVVREVKEEAGVNVARHTLRYVASQPWLFPRSLMLGFIAGIEDDEVVRLGDDELQDARWFDADEVREALKSHGSADGAGVEDGSFHVPSRVSLARTVIDTWLSEIS